MKENKAMFVKALGAALAYSRESIADLDYIEDSNGFEGVTIIFANGDERTIDVTGDSCIAIMHDVYRALV